MESLAIWLLCTADNINVTVNWTLIGPFPMQNCHPVTGLKFPLTIPEPYCYQLTTRIPLHNCLFPSSCHPLNVILSRSISLQSYSGTTQKLTQTHTKIYLVMNLVVKESFHRRTLLSTTERQVNSACVMLEGKHLYCSRQLHNMLLGLLLRIDCRP